MKVLKKRDFKIFTSQTNQPRGGNQVNPKNSKSAKLFWCLRRLGERESKYCWSAAHCKTSHPQMQILLTWNPTRQKTQKLYESQIIPQIYFLSLFGAKPKGRREEMERYQSKYSWMRIQKKRAANIFWEAPLDQQRDESQEISFNCCHNTAM